MNDYLAGIHDQYFDPFAAILFMHAFKKYDLAAGWISLFSSWISLGIDECKQ
jgi:hypothetical protein